MRRTRTGKTRSSDHKKKSEPESGAAAVRVPHDSVNEMVLIAAVIVDEKVRAKYLQHLPPGMFYGTGHAAVWATLQDMDRKGLHYDPATLRQLGGSDVDVNYIEDLISQRPEAPPNLKHHIEMLHWDSARVAAARGPLTRFLEMIKDPKQDPIAVIGAAEQIKTTLQVVNSKSLRSSGQLVDEQMKEIRRRREGVATYGFGIDGLDFDRDGNPRLIPGTSPGNITVITGVSGSGKTTATARGALGMYLQGRRITYGAWEQGSGMTLELLATMSLGYSRTDMMSGKFDHEHELAIEEEMRKIGELITFDEIPFGRTRERNFNDRALDRIAQSIIESRADVYIADLFRRTLKETDPDDEEQALYKVQAIAKATKCHVIIVQQQRLKDVEATKSKLPRRDSIKGSSGYVEVADQIIGFHRPALWKNVPDDRIWSLVLKQRYGRWPIAVEHVWEPEFGVIEDGTEIDMKHPGEDDSDDGFWGSKER